MDVINEWNSCWRNRNCRFERTPEGTGFEAFAGGMTLRHLYALLYIDAGDRSVHDAPPSARVVRLEGDEALWVV